MESHWGLSPYLLLQHSLSYSDWQTPLLKYPPVPSQCIQKRIQNIFLGLQSPTSCTPAYLLAFLSCPLSPHSLCSRHTSHWRMPKHTEIIHTMGISTGDYFYLQILLSDLTPSWHSSQLNCLRETFLHHLGWKVSICHSVSSCFIFSPAFITTRYFLFLFNCLFVSHLACLVYLNPQCLVKSLGHSWGSKDLQLLCKWMSEQMTQRCLFCLPKELTVLSKQWDSVPVIHCFPQWLIIRAIIYFVYESGGWLSSARHFSLGVSHEHTFRWWLGPGLF